MRDDALNKIIFDLAQALRHIDQKPLAHLRRLRPENALGGAFWKFYWAQNLDAAPFSAEDWAYPVHALALLTPTGKPGERGSIHDANRSFGQALHEADVTHLRLARLLAAPFASRRDMLIRAARRLARAGGAFDLRHLARLLLRDDQYDLRRLASDFYQAEARADHKDRESNNA